MRFNYETISLLEYLFEIVKFVEDEEGRSYLEVTEVDSGPLEGESMKKDHGEVCRCSREWARAASEYGFRASLFDRHCCWKLDCVEPVPHWLSSPGQLPTASRRFHPLCYYSPHQHLGCISAEPAAECNLIHSTTKLLNLLTILQSFVKQIQ